jgi:hypothetical protein
LAWFIGQANKKAEMSGFEFCTLKVTVFRPASFLSLALNFCLKNILPLEYLGFM